MKIVVLAVPYLYGIDKCIEKNLKHLGYNVINLCVADGSTHYPNFFHRVIGTFYRKVLRDNDYDKSISYSRFDSEIEKRLSLLKGEKADFALCIRANVYPKRIIRRIRESVDVCINYQWDGIDAHPDILEYADFFDRQFVFDRADIAKYPSYNFCLETNFYFDYVQNKTKKNNGKFYFLGGYQKARVNDIAYFLDKIKELGKQSDFYLVARDDRAKNAFNNRSDIHYLHSSQALSFEENLTKVSECDVVVDFLNDVHQGLSFRTFDAICFDKKLITNNQTIKEYDFYHPNNIYVWNHSNFEGLEEFLNKPYQPLDKQIKEKYSFSQWLKRVLNVE